MDPAEGEVAGFPDLEPVRVRRKHRPADVIGPYEEDLPSLDNSHRPPVHPCILAQEGAP